MTTYSAHLEESVQELKEYIEKLHKKIIVADALAKSCSVLTKRPYLTTTEADDIRAALAAYLEAKK
jgi:hypothetical protein